MPKSKITHSLTPEAAARLQELADARGVCRSVALEALIMDPGARGVLEDADIEDPQEIWLIEWQGRTQSAVAWAKELGISPSTVKYRLRAGHDAETALRTDGIQGEFSGRFSGQ